MASAAHAIPKPCNRLLTALPPEDLGRLWPQLQQVTRSRNVLQVPDEPIRPPISRRPATSPD